MGSHRCGDCLVGQPQLGQVITQGRVQIKPAGLHQTHRRRCRDRLADRADLEQRIRVDRQWMLDVRHPEPCRLACLAVQDPHGDPGDVQMGHLGLDHVTKLLKKGLFHAAPQ